MSVIYESTRLTMLVEKWLKLYKITKKDYEENSNKYKNSFKKKLIEVLLKEPAEFKFNNESINNVISNYFK
jgi:hypothetical protein